MAQGDEDGDALGKVQATLAHHLYRDQIRHLQNLGLWPAAFETEPVAAASALPPLGDDFGREYGNEYGALGADGDLFVNHNRRGLSDSEGEEDEVDEGGEEGEEEGEVEDQGEADALSSLGTKVAEASLGPVSAPASVEYADALRQHITAALNEILTSLPEDPFKTMQKILFQASLGDGRPPPVSPIAQTPAMSAYFAKFDLQTHIDDVVAKKGKGSGPVGGVKFMISDAGDVFTELSKKLKASGGEPMTAEELKAMDAAAAKAKRDKEAKEQAERDAKDAPRTRRKRRRWKPMAKRCRAACTSSTLPRSTFMAAPALPTTSWMRSASDWMAPVRSCWAVS